MHGREDYRFDPGECNDPHRFFRKFGDDPPTAYTFEGGTVWDDFEIRMGSRLDDITLLEELFHTHQCSGKTPEEYRGMRLNNEIEAKLCWYMYRLKIGNMNGVSKNISVKARGDGYLEL